MASDPTPPADPSINNSTAQSYTAAQLITMASHGVANTVFVAPSPKPSWFDDLNAELVAAQTLANQWINTLGVQVSKTIPLQVLDYGPQFNATTAAIMQIVNANPTASGADNPYVIEVQTLIEQTLVPPLNTVLANIDATGTALQTWGTAMQTAQNNLTTGSASIQSAEIALQADIGAMNSAISGLNAEIKAENEAIAAGAAAIGIGVLALVAGIALAPETGGASLVIAGIGAAGVIGGSVTWGVMQAKINSQFKEIAADQQEIAADQAQIVALQGLSTASTQAVDCMQLAGQYLSTLRTQWGTFQGEIQGVLTKLQEADQALSTIVQGVFTQAAVTEWSEAMTTANALVNNPIQVQSQTVPMDSQQAA